MDPTIQAAVRHYMDRSDVLVITRLQCNNTGQQITVGNIHVTWGEMKVPDVQSLQVLNDCNWEKFAGLLFHRLSFSKYLIASS